MSRSVVQAAREVEEDVGTKNERDLRLESLQKSVDLWEKATVADLQRRAASSKKILGGRTGSERLQTQVADQAEKLVSESVNYFLTGEL
jgi:hypothetical protein